MVECDNSNMIGPKNLSFWLRGWGRLGFVLKVLFSFLTCFEVLGPVVAVRPLRERARSWGDEVTFILQLFIYYLFSAYLHCN